MVLSPDATRQIDSASHDLTQQQQSPNNAVRHSNIRLFSHHRFCDVLGYSTTALSIAELPDFSGELPVLRLVGLSVFGADCCHHACHLHPGACSGTTPTAEQTLHLAERDIQPWRACHFQVFRIFCRDSAASCRSFGRGSFAAHTASCASHRHIVLHISSHQLRSGGAPPHHAAHHRPRYICLLHRIFPAACGRTNRKALAADSAVCRATHVLLRPGGDWHAANFVGLGKKGGGG